MENNLSNESFGEKEVKQTLPIQSEKTEKEPKSQKIILLAIFFIASLIALSSVYFFRFYKPATSPTKPSAGQTSPTAKPDEIEVDWKTYTDPLGRFTLKHPNINFFHNDKEIVIGEDSFELNNSNLKYKFLLNIYIDKNTSNLTLEKEDQNLKKNKGLNPQAGIFYYAREIKPYINGQINGLIYQRIYGNGDQSAFSEEIVMVKNDYIYKFNFSRSGDFLRNEGRETVEKILSTFKFIDEVTLTSTISPSISQICAQIITPAKDPVTGECRDFPTPCDIPTGWVKVQNCTE